MYRRLSDADRNSGSVPRLNKSKRGEITDVEANEEYQQLTESGGKARECLACGQCQVACPQHLEIINYLKDVAKCMEKQD